MASAYSTKGTKVCVLKGSETATLLTPTAITAAIPAVVTVASVTGLKAGDIVSIAPGGTGFADIDGKSWIIGDINTTNKTFKLLGSNTNVSGGTLIATPVISHYPNDTSMLCICASSITFNPETAANVSVATFCDPTAQIPSQVVGAGTIEMSGYVDITDAAYKELLTAQSDGVARKWRVTLGNSQGYIVFDGVVAGVSHELPLDGAAAFSVTVNLSAAYRHLF